MKKLYIKLLLFSMPFILIFIFALMHHNYKRFAYHKITVGCSGDFIYHRIYEDTTPIDIAFMGSSKTTNGINDLKIRCDLDDYYNVKINPVVISFCGGGRNMQYSILKMLFKYKKPNLLFLEVNEFEINTSHESYGVVADGCDLIFPEAFQLKYYFRDIGEGLISRFDFLRSGFKVDSIGHISGHGFMPYNHHGDSLQLVEYKESKKLSKTRSTSKLTNIYALRYVQSIVELSNSHGCKVIFLYLPSFGYNGNNIEHEYFYRDLGDIWFPPQEILDNTYYWHDTWHFSRQGADSTTAWIIRRMQEPSFNQLLSR